MSPAPFDGKRFLNAHGGRTRPGAVRRSILTRRRAEWPRLIANFPFDPPERTAAHEIAMTFIGHATFLLQVGGVTILTDPVWSRRASPLRFAGPRHVRQPGQPMEALPEVDVLLVSHCHYDHLDLPTLRDVRARWSPVTATGIGNGRHLAKAGIRDAHELDWWQTVSVNGATTTYVPAQHLKVPLIWVEGRMKKKNPSSGIGLPKRIETAGFAL